MYVYTCMHIVDSGISTLRERQRREMSQPASVNGDVGEEEAGCLVVGLCYRIIAYRAQAVLSPADVNDWG